MRPSNYASVNTRDGLHPSLKRRGMSEEEKRIRRLRNVKSRVREDMQHDEWTASKVKPKRKKLRVGARHRREQGDQQGGRRREDFDTRPDMMQWGGASKSGLRARTLRDTDYIVTEKQAKQRRMQKLRNKTCTSSLPVLPANVSKGGDDNMLSYLDNVGLTEERIMEELPTFEVGMTDKTIPVSEKRVRQQRMKDKKARDMQHRRMVAAEQQQMHQERSPLKGATIKPPNGLDEPQPDIHGMINMMEEEAQSALDFLNENHHPNRSVLPETPEQKPSPGTIFHSSSTSKKKKKRRLKPDPTLHSKTASGSLRRNLDADMGGGDGGNGSPMRGRLRAQRPRVPNAVQAAPVAAQQQQKAAWDPNYARPWRDNKPKKVRRKQEYDDEPTVQVYHPAKANGVYSSAAMEDVYDIDVRGGEEGDMGGMYEHTPIKKRVQKAKKKLKPKTKEINELKSEYKEALGILRDVVERMQNTEAGIEDDNDDMGLSPMIKNRYGGVTDMEQESNFAKPGSFAANFAHKVAEADEVLNHEGGGESMGEEQEEEEGGEDEGDERDELEQDRTEGGLEDDDNAASTPDPDNNGLPLDFSSKKQTLDDYNEWWRKQQEQPGAAAIPQIELGGLGEVSPVRGMRNMYEGSPSPVNANDVSASSSIEAALQEKIERMELVIKEQSGQIEALTNMVHSHSLSPAKEVVDPEVDVREKRDSWTEGYKIQGEATTPQSSQKAKEKTTPPSSIRRKSRFAFDPSMAVPRAQSPPAVSPLSSRAPSPAVSGTSRRKSSVQFHAITLPIPNSVAMPALVGGGEDSDSIFDRDNVDENVVGSRPVVDMGRRRSSVKDRPPTPVKWAKIDLDAMDDEEEDEDEGGDDGDIEIKEIPQRRKSSISFSPEASRPVVVEDEGFDLGERRRSSVKPGTPIKWAKVDLDADDDDDDENDDDDYEDDAEPEDPKPEPEPNMERRRSSVSFSEVEQSVESTAILAGAPAEVDGRRRSSVKERSPTPIKWAKIDLDAEDDDEDDEEVDEEEIGEIEDVGEIGRGGEVGGAGGLDENAAATKMQNIQRQRAAKQRVGKKRKEKEAREEGNAAVVLQGKARQRVARKKVEGKRREKKEREENNAVVVLQGKARQREARKRVEGRKKERREKKESEEDTAATLLQGKVRQRVAKKRVEEKRREAEFEGLSKANSEMAALFGPPPTVVPALPLAETVLQKEVDLEESLEESADQLPVMTTTKSSPSKQDPRTPSPTKSSQQIDVIAPGDAEEIGDEEDVIMTDRSEGLGGKIYHADGSYTTTTTTVDKEVRRLSKADITSPEAAVDVIVGEEEDDNYSDDDDYSFEDDDDVVAETKRTSADIDLR